MDIVSRPAPTVSRISPRRMAVSTVVWSCFGGFFLCDGVQEMIANYASFRWVAWFLIGSAFLAYGIFWAVRLVSRIRLAEMRVPVF